MSNKEGFPIENKKLKLWSQRRSRCTQIAKSSFWMPLVWYIDQRNEGNLKQPVLHTHPSYAGSLCTGEGHDETGGMQACTPSLH